MAAALMRQLSQVRFCRASFKLERIR